MERKPYLLCLLTAVFLFFACPFYGYADILDARFVSGSDGFTYSDDLFGTTNPDWAIGNVDLDGGFQDGGLRVYLGADPRGGRVSGGWTANIFVEKDVLRAILTLRYRLVAGSVSDPSTFGEMLLTIDNNRYGYEINRSIEHISGDVAGSGFDSGWRQIDFPLSVEAGTHALSIGGYSQFVAPNGDWFEFVVDDIVLAAVNSSPIAEDLTFEITAGEPFGERLVASDAENDSLSYSIDTDGMLGHARIVNTTSGEFVYEPENRQSETDTFTYRVFDGKSYSNIATVTLNIVETNTPPAIYGTPADRASVNASYSFQPEVVNQESDALLFSIINQPHWISFDPQTGRIEGIPSDADLGVYSQITILVSDGQYEATLPGFEISVVSANAPPVISGTPETRVVDGMFYEFLPVSVDPDADALTFSIDNQPAWAHFNPQNGALSGIPDALDAGYYGDVTISVSDGEYTAELQPFTLSVVGSKPVPEEEVDLPAAFDAGGTGALYSMPTRSALAAPTISGTPATSVDQDVFYSFIPSANDSDGDPLTFSIVNQPSWASFDTVTGRLSGTPSNADVGVTTGIIIRVSDGAESASLAPFDLTVVNVNDPPVISGTPATIVAQDEPYLFSPSASDPDGDVLTYSIVNRPVWAVFDSGSGELSGTPTNSDVGDYTGIVISVDDGQYTASLSVFDIAVTNVNDAPTISGSPPVSVDEDTFYSFTPGASDPDGDVLTFTITNQPIWASFNTSNGNLYGTPGNGDVGVTSGVVISASDGSLSSSLPPFDLTVVNVNDAPVISGTPGDRARQGVFYSFTPTAVDPDGDPLTFSIVNQPSWMSFDTATGTLSGTPGAGDLGLYTDIVISVSDGQDTDSLSAFSIDVTDANTAPTITGSPSTNVDQDEYYSFTPTADDADGDPLTFSIANQPGWAGFNPSTGTLSGTPGNSDVGIYSGIVISVDDGLDTDSLPPFDITVVNVNDAPTISGTPLTAIAVGAAYNFSPTASDVDGDPLTFSITNQPGWAAFDSATGTLSGIPGASDVGTTTGIVISVSDGLALSSLPAFDLTVVAANNPPVAQNDSFSTPEDTPHSGTLAATDPDGDQLNYSIVSNGTIGNAVITNGSTGAFTYTPDSNMTGSDAFTFRAHDGTVNSNIATVSITITAANDPPTIGGTPPASAAENSLYSFTPISMDVDGDALIFSIANRPSWASFNTGTGTLSGTPGAGDVGTIANSIVITVSDGQASASLPAFSITVTNVADPPTISGTPPTSVVQDTLYSFTPMADDPDNDPLTFSIVNRPTWASFDSGTGTLSGTPGAADIGSTTGIVISVSDGSYVASLPPFNIAVIDANDPPTIVNPPSTRATEGEIYTYRPDAKDPEGDALTYTINNIPSWATFDPTTGVLTGTPAATDVGTATSNIIISVSDGTFTTSLAAFTISVIASGTNASPVISGDPPTMVTQDNLYLFTPAASDADGDPLTFHVSEIPAWASFNNLTGTLSGTPRATDIGTSKLIRISVSDGGPWVSLLPFSITVTDTPDPPTISGTPLTSVNENTFYTFTPTASDPDGDQLTFSISNLPSWASFNTSTGTLFGTPGDYDPGVTIGIVISVTDGSATASLPAFDLTVVNVNDAPVISGTPATSVLQDASYSFTPTASDIENDPLTFAIINKPSWATFDPATGTLFGTPGNSHVGTTTGIVISVNDGQLSSWLPAFSITVVNQNDPPTISGSPATTVDQDVLYVFTPVADDIDGDRLTFSIVNRPSWASFNSNTGTLSGTPLNSHVGTTTGIVISVSDGIETASLPSFDLTVNNVNDPPIISGNPPVNVEEDAAYSFTPTAIDIDGDPLTFSIVNQPTWASFDSGTGTLSGNPTNSDVGITYNVQISVSDGQATASLPVFDLRVSNVNDAPIISGVPSTNATEDVAYSFTPTASDIDGDPLSFSIVNQPAWASFDTETGTLTGTPENIDVGVTTGIVISVSDGELTASLPAFDLTVVNVNDAPVISGTPPTIAPQDVLYSFTPVAADPDNSTLTFTVTNSPTWASFDPATGRLYGIPTGADVGTTTSGIVITVTDGLLSASLPAFNISVTDVNDPPTISGSPATTVQQDNPYSFVPVAVDPEGGALSFSITNRPGWAVFDTTTGALTGTPGDADVGTTIGIVISVTDGYLSSTLPSFNLTVLNVNDPPVISGTPPISVNEDSLYNFTPTASDLDGDALTFSIANQPAWAAFDTATGQLSGTPLNQHVGTTSGVVITVSDGAAQASLPAFDVTVFNTNDPPSIAGNPALYVAQYDNYSFVPTGNDPDVGDVLTFSITNRPSWASFDANTGTLAGVPGESDLGTTAAIVISVTDGQVTASLPAFDLTVTNSNDAPVISGTPAVTVSQNWPYTFVPTASDADDDPLSFSIVNRPPWAAFNTATGQLSGTPSNADVGVTAGIVISVSDGQLSNSLPAFDLEVINVNDAPVISGTPSTLAVQDALYSFTPIASDPDPTGDTISFSISSIPSWATFDTVTGTLSGTPTSANVGMTTSNIVITASDGSLSSLLPAFNITVTNVNDPPLISGTPATVVDEDTYYNFTPTASDPDDDSLTFSIVNRPVWAGFNTATGMLSGTPDNSHVGTHLGIVISVSDGISTVSMTAFDITVNNVNDAPILSGTPSTSVVQGNGYSFTPVSSDPDGDTLTFSIVNRPTWATYNTATGALTGTPSSSDIGTTADIVITASDGQVSTSLPAFSIAVTDVNDPPVISGVPATSVAQDTLYTFTPTASDPEGDALSFSIANRPSWAGFDTGTGTLSGTPGSGDVGTTSGIVISVSDGQLTASLPAFDLTVTNENDAPVISGTPDTSVVQGTPYSFTPVASDPDGDPITFSINIQPSWAAFDTATGTLSGTPGSADIGITPGIIITAIDGQLSSSLAAFDLRVTDANDPPAISGTPATAVDQDTAYSFIPTASDPDGDTLTFSIVNRPSWAAFDTATGTLWGTPLNADVGVTAGIVITVSDGIDSASLAAFDLTVVNVNDAPVISGSPSELAMQDTVYNFTPSASDPDGDTVTFTINLLPTWATFDPATGTLTGTPANTDVGTTTIGIVISATDGLLTSSLPSFDLTVTNENDAPVISGTPPTTVAQDAAYTFTPTASDPDGNLLTFSIVNQPSWAMFNTGDGTLSGTPANADVGTTAGIVITVTDGLSSASLPSFDLTVTNVNDAPTISGTPPGSVAEDTLYSFTPVASDLDGDSLTFSIINSPSWAVFDTVTGTLSGTPDNADVGTTSAIVITVTDGTASASLPAFDLTVTNVNDIPTIGGTPATVVAQGSLYDFTPTASDPDGDALTFSIANQPSWAGFNAATGNLSGTPGDADVGTTTGIVISVSDGIVTVSLPSFDLTVSDANDPPTISGTPATSVVQDNAYSFTPAADDPDGDTLTFGILNQPSWAAFDTATGTLSGTPGSGDVGTTAGIVISVSDGLASDALPAFDLTVTNVNDAPLISGTPSTLAMQETAYSFTPTASDPDGDTLTFLINVQPSWSSFDTATGTLSGTPGSGDIGITTGIVITASDGQLSTSLPAFDLTVTDVNDAPTISGTPATSVVQDTSYSFTPAANDPDGDTLTFSITNRPSWAGFNTNTGTLSGTPGSGDVGTTSGIVITVTDGLASASLAAFDLTVTNVNDAPMIGGVPPVSAAEGVVYSFTPTAVDPDGDVLTFSINTHPTWATFDTATGQLTGTPGSGDVGTTTAGMVISASDGVLISSLPAFDLTVTNINDAPTIGGTPATVVAQGSLYDFTPTASDPDGDALTFSIANQPSWAGFNAATGNLFGTPGDADVGTTTGIVISVSDGQASASLAAFDLTVTNVNDAPVISGTPPTSVVQGSAYSFTPAADDPDGDTLTFSILNQPIWATFDTATGELYGTPGSTQTGTTAGIVITVTDGSLNASLPAFSLTVTNVNDAPTISGTPETTVAQGSDYSFIPTAGDDDGDTLTFSIVNKPVWATFRTDTGELSGVPGSGDVGTTTGIMIDVTDGQLTAFLPAFDLTVTNTNDAPTISGVPSTSVVQNTFYSFTPTASDPDGDVLIYSITNQPSWTTFDTSTGALTGIPGGNDVGTTSGIVVTVSDGSLTDSLTAFDLTVNDNGNDAPVISGVPAATVNQDAAYSFTPTASDPEGDTLTFSIVNRPTWATFETATGQLYGNPGNDDVGTTYSVLISVSDGSLSSSLPAFDLTVVNINDAPVIGGSPATSVAQNAAYSFTPTASDADGDALTYSIANQPSWAGFNSDTGELSGVPGSGDVGTTSGVVISVSDGMVSASLPAFDLTVTDVNDPPQISGFPGTLAVQDNAYSFTPTASDPDAGATLSFSIVNQPGWATFDSFTGQLSGTPQSTDVGTTSGIVISVSDGTLSSSLPAFDLTVKATTNNPPTISGSPATTVAQGAAYTFTPTAGDVDGDAYTFSIVNQPVWAAFDTVTGQLSGTPGSGDVGTTSGVVISVSDGMASASLASFDLTVTNVNDPPTISGSPSTSVSQDAAYSFTPTAGDPDGDTLAFSIVNQPSWAAFDTATGQLSGTPGNSDVGTTSGIVITVTDGTLSADLAAFDIEVINVNDRPTISGTPATLVAQDSAYSFTPTADDPDGDTLTFTIVNMPGWASFDTATGALTGTPAAVNVGNYSGIVISVQDASLSSSLPSFNIRVSGPPTIGGSPATTVAQDSTYSFTPTASDPDGDALTFSIVNRPAWATFSTVTGQLSGIPGNDDVGVTTGIQISVSDGSFASSLAAFDLTVTDVNDAPMISGTPSTTVTQGNAYNFTPTASDADGDSLTFSIVNRPIWANFDTLTGALTGTPANGDVGTTSGIVISVTDAVATSSLPAFDLTVRNANDSPVISGAPGTSVNEDTAYTFTPTSSDPDGDALTFSIANKPAWAGFDTSTGTLSGTPANGDVGVTSGIVITVSDGQLSASLAAFDLTVVNTNDAPTIGGTPSTTVTQGNAYSFTPTASDVDVGATLTFSIVNRPSWASFSTTTGALTGTPGSGDVGTTSGIVISVSDGIAPAVSLAAFDLTVVNVNDPPVISGTPGTSVNEDTAYSFTPTASDPDGNPLTFSIVNQPSWANFSTATGTLSGTPTNANVGTTGGIVITVSDGQLSASLAAFDLTVVNVNDAPTISGTPPTSVDQGVSYSFTPSAADADGDSLTFSIVNQPAWIGFDAGTGTISGIPAQGDVGVHAGIAISVNDGTLSNTLAAFDITVVNVNDAPTISGTPGTSVNEDTAYSFTPTTSDLDGDVLTFSIANQPGWAAFDTATGALTGTPTSAHIGTTSGIVISVSDGTLSAALPAFNLTVTNVNEAPTIGGAPGTSVNEDTAYTFTPTSSDPDGDTLTFSIANKPVWAGFDTSTGTLSGTPANGDVGVTSGIVITVSDGQLSASLAAFDLTVVNTNDAPTIGGTPSTTVTQGNAYSFTPTASDVDVGATLTFSIVNRPSWASFSTTTGALTGTPGSGDVGTTSGIVISVSDGIAPAVSLAAFDLTVVNVNDPPVISGTPGTSVNEDTAYSFTPTASDPDGNPLTFSIVNQPSWANFSTATGTLSGTPVNANVGTTSGIVITVSDGQLSASLAAFDLTVVNVNDAPTISGTPLISVAQNTAYSFTPTANDPDGDTLTFSIVNQPAWTSFSTTTGALTGTPGSADVGTTIGIVISVDDGSGLVSLPAFDLTVTNANDAPTISGTPAISVAQDAAYTFTPTTEDPDGDTLTFSIVNKPSWATFSTTTGTLSGTPGATDVATTAGIVITVSDGQLSASLPAFDLTVTNVNDAPTISGTPATSVAQDTAYSFTPTANDLDGDTLTFSIANPPAWAAFDPATGALTGTPTASDVGTTAGIVISVSDGIAAPVSLPAFDLAVVNVNDAPTISGTPATSVAQESLYSFTPTADDPDGDTLTFSIVNKPTWAAFDFNTGTLSGTPGNEDVTTTTGIVITVSDGQLTASLPAFDLTVTNVNDAPVISGTPITSIGQDIPYSFTPTASDPDGDTLTFSIANSPTWANFDTATGTLSGTPTNADVGTSTGIVITVSDGTLSASLPAFDITVTNANDAPTISGTPTTSADEDAVYSFTPTAEDPDGDSLSFTIANKPAWASFDTNTGALTGMPANADVGTTTGIVITVSDGQLSASLPAFDLTVVNTNDAPTISGTPDTTIGQGSAYSFTPAAADDDGDPLTFSIVNAPSWSIFDANTGALTGTPGAEDVGTTTGIVISVSDGIAAPVSLPAFDLTVSDVNDAPTIGGTPETSVAQGELYSFIPTASDPDGDTLIFSITNQPDWAAFNTGTGELSGTPANEDVGTTASIVITVSDGQLSAALAAFDLTVTNVNDAPTISGTPDTTVAQNSAYGFIPTASDPDGDSLTFSIVNQPSWAAFSAVTGELSGTPGSGDVGTTTGIVISVSDGALTASLPAFDLTVGDVNDPPTIAGVPAASVAQDAAYSFTPTADDPDGDILTFSIQNRPTWASFDSTTGALTGTPTNADIGTTSGILITVSDGQLSASLQTFSIEVTNVNDAPTISGYPSPTALEETPYQFVPTAGDLDGDPLTFSIVNRPLWANFNTTTGALTGTPTAADRGTTTGIVISVSDGLLSASLPAFDLEVRDMNHAPVATAASFTTDEDVVIVNTLTASDSDGDSLVFSIVGQPTLGTVAITDVATGAFTYTPNANVFGGDGFTFKASDGISDSSTVQVSITINALNDAPTITTIAPTTANQGYLYLYDAAASDAEGDTLTWSLVNEPTGMMVGGSTGLVSWTPGTGVTTSGAVTLTVSDGNGGMDSEIFTITVSADPQPAVSITASPENIYSGDPSTLSWDTSNADTVSILPSIGEVAVSGTLDVYPTTTTTYTITASGAGGTAEASVTVTVSRPVVAAALNTGTLVDEFVSIDGTLYSTDSYFTGGNTDNTGRAISNTVDDTLYQSSRYGTSFSYDIPVANGDYDVEIKMAEIVYAAVGSRVFNVTIEGNQLISNLDIYNEVGSNTAYDEIFPVVVTDGELNIEFIGVTGEATVSAIRVLALDTDTDGISDIDETGIYGTNPNVADTDGDGLSDGDELDYWGADWNTDYDGDSLNNLVDGDSDADGFLDGAEIAQGSDPSDPDSTP